MKKIVQDKNGLRQVDGDLNPEFFDSEELRYKDAVTDRERIDIIAKYLNLK